MQKKSDALVQPYEQQVQKGLEDFFAEQEKNARAISPDYGTLWCDIKTVSLAGGKRMRPRMALLAYQAFGGTTPGEIAPLAIALELLHQFLLIHDDIIDRDAIRHGVANMTGRYDQHYGSLISQPHERRHFAQSAALLAGDVLHGAAHTMLATSTLPQQRLQKVQAAFGQAVFEVGGGELLDTESTFRSHDHIETLAIGKYKTASYSFVAPLLIGAIAADADPASCAALHIFAEDLGIAFQLRDDLLGVFGDEDTTGKSSVGDLREGKYTELIRQFRQLATAEHLAIYQEVFGNKEATAAQMSALKTAITESGARTAIETLIQTYEARARKELDFLQLNPAAHDQFEALIDKAVRRQK